MLCALSATAWMFDCIINKQYFFRLPGAFRARMTALSIVRVLPGEGGKLCAQSLLPIGPTAGVVGTRRCGLNLKILIFV